MKHIIDVLIEERAPGLMSRPLLWRAIQPTILPLLGYRHAIEATDRVGSSWTVARYRTRTSQFRCCCNENSSIHC